MRHELEHSGPRIILPMLAAVLLTATAGWAQEQRTAGPTRHADAPHSTWAVNMAQLVPAVAKTGLLGGLQHACLEKLVQFAVESFSKLQGRLLSGNRADLLSKNRATVLSDNTALSGNRGKLLCDNEPRITCGNRLSILLRFLAYPGSGCDQPANTTSQQCQGDI